MVYTKVPNHSDTNNKKTIKKTPQMFIFQYFTGINRYYHKTTKKMNPMLPKLRVEGSSPFSRSLIVK